MAGRRVAPGVAAAETGSDVVDFMTSIWATIKGWPGAILTGVALLFSGGLWVWFRRNPPRDIPSLPPGHDSPEHAKIDQAAARQLSETEARIRAEAKRVRDKLLGGGGCLLAFAIISLSCARPLPVVRDIGPIPRAHLALEEACAPEGDRVCCSREGIGRAIDASEEAAVAGEHCRLALSAEREHRGVDQQAAVKVAAELDSVLNQRWWFAVGGLVLGGLVAGLAAGFAVN